MLAHGAVVNRNDLDGYSALHNACWKGRSSIAIILLSYHASVFKATAKGDTALHLACQSGDLNLVDTIIYAAVKEFRQKLEEQNSKLRRIIDIDVKGEIKGRSQSSISISIKDEEEEENFEKSRNQDG